MAKVFGPLGFFFILFFFYAAVPRVATSEDKHAAKWPLLIQIHHTLGGRVLGNQMTHRPSRVPTQWGRTLGTSEVVSRLSEPSFVYDVTSKWLSCDFVGVISSAWVAATAETLIQWIGDCFCNHDMIQMLNISLGCSISYWLFFWFFFFATLKTD